MIRQRNQNFRQRQEALLDGFDALGRLQSAMDVGNTLYNIINEIPGEPSPLPILDPVQPFPGIPFYMDNPDNPADPTDCDAYPDSPFCGGNPVDIRFARLNPIIIADGCNLGVRFENIFGYIRLPPVNFIYRNPACRYPESDPPSEPGEGYTDFDVPIPAEGCQCFVNIGFWVSGRRGVAEFHSGRMPRYIIPEGNFAITNSFFPSYVLDSVWTVIASETSWTAEKDGEIDENRTSYSQFSYSFRYTSSDLTNGRLRLYTTENSPWAVTETACFPCAIPPEMPFTFPPLPPPPLSPPPMTCCPDDLIRLLIQKVDRLSQVIGIDEYPATVPESFISRRDGFLNLVTPPNTTEVQNLTKFIEKYVTCFNELMGEWEIPIEVEESNTTISARQGTEIRLPSMAEAITKMMLLALQTSTDSKALPTIKNQISSLSSKASTPNIELGTEYLDNQLVSVSAKVTTPQGAESLGQEYLHNQMISVSAKTNAAEKAEVLGQEYLHNQVVSVSAKVTTSQGTDALGQEYLHNQMVSVSTKITTAQGAETSGQEYLHNQVVSVSAKVTTSQGTDALGQEYLHNQVVSVSAKITTAQGAEVLGQEYLHNQLVSVSAKVATAQETDAASYEYLYNQVVSGSAKVITAQEIDAAGQEYLHNQVVSGSVKSITVNLSKLLEIAGIDDFPITVPESLISKFAENSTTPIPVNEINLTSLPQFFHWYVKRFDEFTGQWEIPIEIKDTDPTTPGDQSQMIKLPNLGESVGEMMIMLIQAVQNLNTLVSITTRTLYESGQDKLQNHKSHAMIQSIVDYLGFEHKDIVQKVPFMFTPDKERLDELLQEIEIEVPTIEFSDKQTFRKQLTELLHAAAITRTVHWRKVDKNKDIKEQIKKRIKDLRDIDNLLAGNKEPDETDDFEQFIEDFEDGFRSYTNVTDAANPYGNSYDERPKIKKIGDQSLSNQD